MRFIVILLMFAACSKVASPPLLKGECTIIRMPSSKEVPMDDDASTLPSEVIKCKSIKLTEGHVICEREKK